MTMPKQRRYPTYALIVPAPADWLQTKTREARNVLFPPSEDDDIAHAWKIVGGKGEHSAIWDFDPAGDTAWDLAPLISRQVKGRVHVAQLHEQTRGSYAYEGGKGLGEVPEDPEKLASRLGVPFPEAELQVSSSELPSSDRRWSVCLIEGTTPEELVRAIKLSPDDVQVVKIDPRPLGSIVYATDGSPVLGIAAMVNGPGLEDATTYALERAPDNVLKVWIWRGGKIVQFFTTDEEAGPAPSSAERVWDIKGAKDTSAILNSLQIPPMLLGL